jgi:hypothetical protein
MWHSHFTLPATVREPYMDSHHAGVRWDCKPAISTAYTPAHAQDSSVFTRRRMSTLFLFLTAVFCVHSSIGPVRSISISPSRIAYSICSSRGISSHPAGRASSGIVLRRSRNDVWRNCPFSSHTGHVKIIRRTRYGRSSVCPHCGQVYDSVTIS